MTDEKRSTAEAMAIAVLRGDFVAAAALADFLVTNLPLGARELKPVKLVAGRDRLRVVANVTDWRMVEGTEYATNNTINNIRDSIDDWLRNGQTLLLPPWLRIELYELPEASP